MMKFILLALLISNNSFAANSIKKSIKKLSKKIKIKIIVEDSLVKEKEICTRQMFKAWESWWDQVESPYKEQYINSLKKLSSINIKSSKVVQSISGNQNQLFLIKSVCTGGPLGRSCQKLDSSFFRFKSNLKLSGQTPKFELNIGSSADIHIEKSEDSSTLKRYDTYSKSVYEKVLKNKKLFDNYYRIGIIGQMVKPGTDNSQRILCSFPQFAEILISLQP